MAQIDEIKSGAIKAAARTLLIYGRFWVLALAETLKCHLTLRRLSAQSMHLLMLQR